MDRHWAERDIEALLGVYALDGLDADERAVVDGHLADCPRCAAEVGWHRHVAALLTAGGPPPPGVWSRIASALGESPAPRRSGGHRRWRPRLLRRGAAPSSGPGRRFEAGPPNP